MGVERNIHAAWCAVSVVLVGLSVVGCGVGVPPVGAGDAIATLQGTAHGGPNPVVAATVNLYATTSGGYGASPTLLATTVTDNSGSFTFTSPAACPSGQQAYITAYGGNPGAGANPNYLLVAALGPCANISSSTSIWISEVTTVAAAYALSSFTAIGGTASAPVVQVGAPANNNATTGTCTTAANVTSGCVAAGLTHAFANALNLANSVTTSAGTPTGAAYSVTPSNPNGSVPQGLVNSLANSVEACVNSTGGTAGDGTACGNLFTYTTMGGVTPTNTLQALLNVARYPALTAANVANLYGRAPATSPYHPTLSAAPTDFSLAIAYTGVAAPGTVGTITPTVNNGNASSFGSGDAYTSVPAVTISAPPAGGTQATANASLGLVYFNVTGGTCSAGTNNVTITGGGGSGATATATYNSSGVAVSGAVTASGAGYTSVPSFTVANCTVQPSAAQKVKGMGVVAVTVTNAGSGYTSAPSVTIAAPPSSTSPANVTAQATSNFGSVNFAAPYSMTLDANDNVYIGSQNMLGSAGANSFASAISANGSSLFTTVPSTTYTAPRGAAADTLGTVWFAQNTTQAVQGLNAVTGSVVQTIPTGTALLFGLAVDRANNLWYGTASSGVQNLFELQQSSNYASVNFAPNLPQFTNPVRAVAFDANQNVYVSGFSTSTNTAGVFANTGSAAAPAYGANATINTTLGGSSGAGLALDSSGNAWMPTSTGLFEVTPAYSGAAATSFAVSGSSPFGDNSTAPNYDAVDGAGNIWMADNQNQKVVQYVPSTTTATGLSPCYAPAGGTTCGTGLVQPQRLQVDSAGSVWITSLSNGRVYQLLGTATPAWPQLSLGAPGVMPQ